VGTSITFNQSRLCLEDHPHACGDKPDGNCQTCFDAGSSPRVWGQDVVFDAVKVFIGIIPTRVGTSEVGLGKSACRQDHPHACGDKVFVALLTGLFGGSSPRVWGQVKHISYRCDRSGIIPTRVGTSVLVILSLLKPRDHPHACGDKPF